MKCRLCVMSADDDRRNVGGSCYTDAKRDHRGIPRTRESIRIRLTAGSWRDNFKLIVQKRVYGKDGGWQYLGIMLIYRVIVVWYAVPAALLVAAIRENRTIRNYQREENGVPLCKIPKKWKRFQKKKTNKSYSLISFLKQFLELFPQIKIDLNK